MLFMHMDALWRVVSGAGGGPVRVENEMGGDVRATKSDVRVLLYNMTLRVNKVAKYDLSPLRVTSTRTGPAPDGARRTGS